MPNQAGDFLLNFDELPLRIQLEGCPGEVARSIAYQWFCPVHSRAADSGAFRVRFRVEPGLRFRPSASTRFRGQVRLRVQTLSSTSRLLLSGTRTTLTAGGSVAEIEVHPQVLHDPHLMEQATGGALGHALALASASFLHSAALIVDDLPILLLGGPQAGKSTVSAATLSTGGTVISDDSLILYRSQADGLAIRALRRDLLLREGSLQVLPLTLQRRLRQIGPASDPRWVHVRQESDRSFRSTMAPAMLCVLRRDRRLASFRLEPMSQALALASLLEANSSPHLLHPEFPGEQQALMSLWIQLVSELPAFELRLGSALLESPEALLHDVAERLRELGGFRVV